MNTEILLTEVQERCKKGFYQNWLELKKDDLKVVIFEVTYTFSKNYVIGYVAIDGWKDWFCSSLYYKKQKEPRFNLRGKSYCLADFRKELRTEIPVNVFSSNKAKQRSRL